MSPIKTQQDFPAAEQRLLERKSREHELLLTLAQAIAGARNRQDLLHIVTDQLLELFNARYYTLCLINEDGQTHSPFLHTESGSIRTRTGESPIIHERHPIEDGIFDIALATEKPLVLSLQNLMKRGKTPPYIVHWFNAGIREMMVVRVCNGENAIGLFYLYAASENTFNPDQYLLLTGISGLLGTGISNILANEKISFQLEEIRRYKQQLEQENTYLKEEQRRITAFSGLIGDSVPMLKIQELIGRVAGSDATVLILGETGTGKELVARSIHEASPRKDRLMIKVNCAAMPAALMESELFGHEKGAFTGALERRIGKFELAHNSTLFLDEIGELPLELQVKLLRALQEKEIERVGGNNNIKVNVRIIAATNRNLEEEMQAGRFRSDLYYRLHVFPVTIPPLRERMEDVPRLVQHFIERYGQLGGKKVSGITRKALESLMTYCWPGNIRELEHLVERSVLLCNEGLINEVALPAAPKQRLSLSTDDGHIRPLEEIERAYILKALKLCKGRISGPNGAAVRLGLPPTTLISKMQRLGIRKDHVTE